MAFRVCRGVIAMEVRKGAIRLVFGAEDALDPDADVERARRLCRVRVVELEEEEDVISDPLRQPGRDLTADERIVIELRGEGGDLLGREIDAGRFALFPGGCAMRRRPLGGLL